MPGQETAELPATEDSTVRTTSQACEGKLPDTCEHDEVPDVIVGRPLTGLWVLSARQVRVWAGPLVGECVDALAQPVASFEPEGVGDWPGDPKLQPVVRAVMGP